MGNLRTTVGIAAFILTAGCVSKQYRSSIEADRKSVHDELDEEMSLKADRDELAELRKQIPEETRVANDELALNLQLMKQGAERPDVVHSKFSSLVEKRRTSFRKKVQKLRDDYRNYETKRRDAFLNSQKLKRSNFNSVKRTTEETKEFFAAQDKARQNFFADERDRRANFESEMTAQSRDFDSYMREKHNEFNEQYRLYSKSYYEKKKDKKAVTGDSEFKRIDDVPAKEMKTEE